MSSTRREELEEKPEKSKLVFCFFHSCRDVSPFSFPEIVGWWGGGPFIPSMLLEKKKEKSGWRVYRVGHHGRPSVSSSLRYV